MFVGRLVVILFLILAILFTYSPFVREGISQSWEAARPDVILVMDALYATIRNFVAGTDSHDGIHDDAPGVDFNMIITRNTSSFS